jgi:alpha-1,3-rhamnosyl/mannosyltransferase
MPIIFDARPATAHFPGIGRYVSNLTRAMAHFAPEGVTLITPPSVDVALPAWPRVTSAVSPFALSQQWHIPALLRQQRATLYHSAYYLMPYAPGAPTVVTFYDLIPLFLPEHFRPAQRLIYRLTHFLALTTAKVGLAISRTTQADLMRVFHAPPGKIIVTPLAADPRFSPRPRIEITALRHQYGLPEKYGLFVGSNKPHKNLPALIEAYAHTARAMPLVIAGAWEARYPEARQRVAQLGLQTAVKFLGPMPEADLPALYSGAAWFVFPSRYEGFGLPPLEAMACGAPALCADIPVLREIAADAALYFDLAQPAMLTAQLHRLQTEPLDEWRARSVARAAQFTWARAAQQTWAAYGA